MLRHLPYRKFAVAEFGGSRIERVFDRSLGAVAIRFSAWRGGKIVMRPLSIREDELAVLIGEAVAAGVFSAALLGELQAILAMRLPE